MKSYKAKQNGKEELRRAQTKAKAQNQHKSSKSRLPLKSTPHNTLNASSLLDSHLSCFFSQPPG
jgi:hypothetical protein